MKRYKPNVILHFTKSMNFIPSIRINLLDWNKEFNVVTLIPGFLFLFLGISFKINLGNEYQWTKYLMQKNVLEN